MANNTKVTIDGDASGVVKAVGVAQGALGKLQTQMTALEAVSAKGLSFGGLAGIGLSATAAVGALVSVTKSAADYGDQLDNMSQRTGVAVEDLAKLQYAAKMSDTTTEALGKGMAYLAGQVASAATGVGASADLFEQYGIAVRNADGSVRNTADVLGDLADVFAAMPDGTTKAALATEFFGKKLGGELIPLLNNGKEGLKALGDEAERLGLVMSGEQAKAAAEFNDAMDKLSNLAAAAGRSVGMELIPILNKFFGMLIDARNNKLSLWQFLYARSSSAGEDPVDKLKQASAELAKLKAEMASAQAQNAQDGGSIDTSGIEAQIAAQEKLVGFFKDQIKRTQVEEEMSAGTRARTAADLASKQSLLEKKRAVAAGEASADILKSDKELNDARIKDAERLRDALKSAYEATTAEAKKAADESVKLFDQARKVRTSAADKATEMGMEGLSPEEKAAANAKNAQSMLDQGRYYAAAAGAAKLDGRLQQMEQYQKQAQEYLDRAQQFAEKSGDAGLVQGVAEQQARALEEQARLKADEAKAAEQRAADQMATLNAVEAKLKDLNTTAAQFELKADLSQLESDIEALKKKLGEGATMPIKMVPQGAPGTTAADGTYTLEPYLPTRAYGGPLPGRAPHDRADNMLYWGTPGEWVIQRPAVRHYGSAFIDAINRMALPKYANGGLLGAMSLPSLPSPAMMPGSASSKTPLVLDFGKLGRVQAETSTDAAAELTRIVTRAALQFGRR